VSLEGTEVGEPAFLDDSNKGTSATDTGVDDETPGFGGAAAAFALLAAVLAIRVRWECTLAYILKEIVPIIQFITIIC